MDHTTRRRAVLIHHNLSPSQITTSVSLVKPVISLIVLIHITPLTNSRPRILLSSTPLFIFGIFSYFKYTQVLY